MTAPKMTEHKKLQGLEDRMEFLKSFLDFLDRGSWQICRTDGYNEVEERLKTDNNFIYSYFGVDPAALEAEREQAVKYALEH